MAKPKLKNVTLNVSWGYELHSLTIPARKWAKILRGEEVWVRGERYFYEGERFGCGWCFNRKGPNTLIIGYGNNGAVGYEGPWECLEREEIYEEPRTGKPKATDPAPAARPDEPSMQDAFNDVLAKMRKGMKMDLGD